MTNLSKHFTLAELTYSDTARGRGIINLPGPVALRNLSTLADTLERVRSLVGGPLGVSSGFRCIALNRVLLSNDNSAHVQGLAADINSKFHTPKQLAKLIHESGIEYDQLIEEGTWIHLGLRAELPMRRENLTMRKVNGKTTYTKGIAF